MLPLPPTPPPLPPPRAAFAFFLEYTAQISKAPIISARRSLQSDASATVDPIAAITANPANAPTLAADAIVDAEAIVDACLVLVGESMRTELSITSSHLDLRDRSVTTSTNFSITPRVSVPDCNEEGQESLANLRLAIPLFLNILTTCNTEPINVSLLAPAICIPNPLKPFPPPSAPPYNGTYPGGPPSLPPFITLSPATLVPPNTPAPSPQSSPLASPPTLPSLLAPPTTPQSSSAVAGAQPLPQPQAVRSGEESGSSMTMTIAAAVSVVLVLMLGLVAWRYRKRIWKRCKPAALKTTAVVPPEGGRKAKVEMETASADGTSRRSSMMVDDLVVEDLVVEEVKAGKGRNATKTVEEETKDVAETLVEDMVEDFVDEVIEELAVEDLVSQETGGATPLLLEDDSSTNLYEEDSSTNLDGCLVDPRSSVNNGAGEMARLPAVGGGQRMRVSLAEDWSSSDDGLRHRMLMWDGEAAAAANGKEAGDEVHLETVLAGEAGGNGVAHCRVGTRSSPRAKRLIKKSEGVSGVASSPQLDHERAASSVAAGRGDILSTDREFSSGCVCKAGCDVLEARPEGWRARLQMDGQPREGTSALLPALLDPYAACNDDGDRGGRGTEGGRVKGHGALEVLEGRMQPGCTRGEASNKHVAPRAVLEMERNTFPSGGDHFLSDGRWQVSQPAWSKYELVKRRLEEEQRRHAHDQQHLLGEAEQEAMPTKLSAMEEEWERLGVSRLSEASQLPNRRANSLMERAEEAPMWPRPNTAARQQMAAFSGTSQLEWTSPADSSAPAALCTLSPSDAAIAAVRASVNHGAPAASSALGESGASGRFDNNAQQRQRQDRWEENAWMEEVQITAPSAMPSFAMLPSASAAHVLASGKAARQEPRGEPSGFCTGSSMEEKMSKWATRVEARAVRLAGWERFSSHAREASMLGAEGLRPSTSAAPRIASRAAPMLPQEQPAAEAAARPTTAPKKVPHGRRSGLHSSVSNQDEDGERDWIGSATLRPLSACSDAMTESAASGTAAFGAQYERGAGSHVPKPEENDDDDGNDDLPPWGWQWGQPSVAHPPLVASASADLRVRSLTRSLSSSHRAARATPCNTSRFEGLRQVRPEQARQGGCVDALDALECQQPSDAAVPRAAPGPIAAIASGVEMDVQGARSSRAAWARATLPAELDGCRSRPVATIDTCPTPDVAVFYMASFAAPPPTASAASSPPLNPPPPKATKVSSSFGGLAGPLRRSGSRARVAFMGGTASQTADNTGSEEAVRPESPSSCGGGLCRARVAFMGGPPAPPPADEAVSAEDNPIIDTDGPPPKARSSNRVRWDGPDRSDDGSGGSFPALARGCARRISMPECACCSSTQRVSLPTVNKLDE